MASILTYVIMTVIIIIATMLVFNIINPMVEEGQMTQTYTEALGVMRLVDSQIHEVFVEAPGSRRTVDVSLRKGSFQVTGGSDEIKIILENSEFFSPGRTKEGNIIVKSGNYIIANERDIDNDGNTDLVLENDAMIFAVKKLGSESNNVSVNTTNFITQIKNKRTGTIAVPVTGLYINDNDASSAGSGFTELTRIGDHITSSGIRLWLNSSAGLTYEAIFTIDSPSDFVTLEIRHIE